MKLIIHDLDQSEADRLFGQHPDDATIIGKDQAIHQCVGCFGCWIETPGLCKIKDAFSDIGKRMAQSDEVEIISRCLYGGFSPFVKNVLDRTLPYHQPYFTIRAGEMHQKDRYQNHVNLSVRFYGDDITPAEKATAEQFVAYNGIDLDAQSQRVSFYKNLDEMEAARS
jgi:multimeric flavodoxin WrbA